jgi:hypothetical protein
VKYGIWQHLTCGIAFFSRGIFVFDMYPIDSIIWFFSCNGELVSGFFLNECTELQCTFVDWPLGYDAHMYVKFGCKMQMGRD